MGIVSIVVAALVGSGLAVATTFTVVQVSTPSQSEVAPLQITEEALLPYDAR